MNVSRDEFENIVYQKFEALPTELRERLENVALMVENAPRRSRLLGLYHGVPFPRRKTGGYSLVLPDRIILYQEPIEDNCRTMEELENRIEQVLHHEIGHYLGLGENQLRFLGL